VSVLDVNAQLCHILKFCARSNCTASKRNGPENSAHGRKPRKPTLPSIYELVSFDVNDKYFLLCSPDGILELVVLFSCDRLVQCVYYLSLSGDGLVELLPGVIGPNIIKRVD